MTEPVGRASRTSDLSAPSQLKAEGPRAQNAAAAAGACAGPPEGTTSAVPAAWGRPRNEDGCRNGPELLALDERRGTGLAECRISNAGKPAIDRLTVGNDELQKCCTVDANGQADRPRSFLYHRL